MEKAKATDACLPVTEPLPWPEDLVSAILAWVVEAGTFSTTALEAVEDAETALSRQEKHRLRCCRTRTLIGRLSRHYDQYRRRHRHRLHRC